MLFDFASTIFYEGQGKILAEVTPSRSITSWDSLVENFFERYFPPGHSAKLKIETLSFQGIDKSVLWVQTS